MAARAAGAGRALAAACDDVVAELGLVAAPPGAFVASAAVLAAVRAAAAGQAEPVVKASTAFLSAAVLGALQRACGGRVARRRAPYARKDGETALFWAVCGPSLPAAPFGAHAVAADPTSDKKARRESRRLARGLEPPDPARCRVYAAECRGAVRHFTRYTDELLTLRSAPQLLALRLWPNAKELTESFACFAAAREQLADLFSPDDPSVTVVVVGDGLTPRTAALFAFRTRWKAISIDPLMEGPPEGPPEEAEAWSTRVERLTAVRGAVGPACSRSNPEARKPAPEQAAGQSAERAAGAGGRAVGGARAVRFAAERLLLVLPHAHVGLSTCLAHVSWARSLGAIQLPCCDWYSSTRGCGPPAYEGEDHGVVSPHRLVRVWRWTSEQCLPPAVPPASENVE